MGFKQRLRRPASAPRQPIEDPSDHCIKNGDRQNPETRTGLLVRISGLLRRPYRTRRPCSVQRACQMQGWGSAERLA